MPPRSRRALLEAASALAVGLAGCGTETPDTGTQPPTTSSTQLTTSPLTEAPVETPAPSSLRCGAGPRPDADWPLARRSASHDSFDSDGRTIDDRPVASWSIEPDVPPDVEEREAAFSQPVVAGDLLYVSSRVQYGPELVGGGHTVQARDRSTGELQWSKRLPRRPPSPAVRGEDVFFPSAGTLYALDRRDGSTRWTRSLDVYGRVVPTSERIYAWGEHVVALAPDGTTTWTRPFDDSTVQEPPAVGSERVFVGLDGGRVVALDPATGETEWTARTSRSDEDTRPPSPNVYTVVATDCGVFVVADGDVAAFDTAGERVWQVEGNVVGLTTDGRTLYSRDRDPDPHRTVLRARDAATGELRWERPYEVTSGAHGVLTDDVLYVPTEDELLALAPDDGRKLWGRASSVGSLALAGGTLYGTHGHEGPLVALQ